MKKHPDDKTPAAEFAYHFPNHIRFESRRRLMRLGIWFTVAQIVVALLIGFLL